MTNKTKIITIITATIITFIASMALILFVYWQGGLNLNDKSLNSDYAIVLSTIISFMISSYPKEIIENRYKEKEK